MTIIIKSSIIMPVVKTSNIDKINNNVNNIII